MRLTGYTALHNTRRCFSRELIRSGHLIAFLENEAVWVNYIGHPRTGYSGPFHPSGASEQDPRPLMLFQSGGRPFTEIIALTLQGSAPGPAAHHSLWDQPGESVPGAVHTTSARPAPGGCVLHSDTRRTAARCRGIRIRLSASLAPPSGEPIQAFGQNFHLVGFFFLVCLTDLLNWIQCSSHSVTVKVY